MLGLYSAQVKLTQSLASGLRKAVQRTIRLAQSSHDLEGRSFPTPSDPEVFEALSSLIRTGESLSFSQRLADFESSGGAPPVSTFEETDPIRPASPMSVSRAASPKSFSLRTPLAFVAEKSPSPKSPPPKRQRAEVSSAGPSSLTDPPRKILPTLRHRVADPSLSAWAPISSVVVPSRFGSSFDSRLESHTTQTQPSVSSLRSLPESQTPVETPPKGPVFSSSLLKRKHKGSRDE